jgi:menaquinone-dependent protoporphyrinogen IX oxidase
MCSNTVVIYKSKYGSTKKYAVWISEELNADLIERSKVKVDDLLKYETIIYGGSLHAVGIKGFDIIKNNITELKDKNIILFSVGAAPIRQDTIDAVRKGNINDDNLKDVNLFCFRGAFNFQQLDFVDRNLMRLLKLKIERNPTKTENEIQLLAAYETPVDFTAKDAIAPLIQYSRENCINT